MPTYIEKFFIPQPEPAAAITFKGSDKDAKERTLAGYTSGGELLKWSADFPLPAVGSRVFVTMNSIGWAVVKGYWSADGWLGVMALATNPPAYLRKQNREDRKDMSKPQWHRDGIGCLTGMEIELKRPRWRRK